MEEWSCQLGRGARGHTAAATWRDGSEEATSLRRVHVGAQLSHSARRTLNSLSLSHFILVTSRG